MLSKLLRSKAATGAALVVAVLLVTSVVSPAFGAPSPLSIAKKALKTSKKADKRSKKALKHADQARTAAGNASTRAGTAITNSNAALARANTALTAAQHAADGAGDLIYRFSDDAPFNVSGNATATAHCDPGSVPLGGGGVVFDTQGTPSVIDDTQVRDGSVTIGETSIDLSAPAWDVSAHATTTTNRVLDAFVICGVPTSISKQRR